MLNKDYFTEKASHHINPTILYIKIFVVSFRLLWFIRVRLRACISSVCSMRLLQLSVLCKNLC